MLGADGGDDKADAPVEKKPCPAAADATMASAPAAARAGNGELPPLEPLLEAVACSPASAAAGMATAVARPAASGGTSTTLKSAADSRKGVSAGNSSQRGGSGPAAAAAASSWLLNSTAQGERERRR